MSSQKKQITAFLTSFFAISARARIYCTYGQSCLPSAQERSSFNNTVGGRLISPLPPAYVCHGDRYDENLCNVAKTNWTVGPWRADQPGAFQVTNWENGNSRCFIDAPREDVCQQGLVPVIGVAAESVLDIQNAIKFAAKNNLYLVVKNTGHD
jgi:hypothetical protein